MPTKTLDLAWPANYQISSSADPRRLVVLLHGFRERGATVYAKLMDCFAADDLVLAPDAPFPLPVQGAGATHMGFAWYFFDPENDRYLLDMEFALTYLQRLIQSLDLEHLPKTIVGYSQGGYLAPFLGIKLNHVRQVVGINCRFRSEVLVEPLAFRLDAIHGSEDRMVDAERARACHQHIRNNGTAGEFHAVPGQGHNLNPELRNRLGELVRA